MEESARTIQEMADLVRRTCLDKTGGVRSENLLHPRSPTPDSGRLTVEREQTEGDSDHSLLLSRSKTDEAPIIKGPTYQISPPRSPLTSTCKTTLLSPVTPLELGGSPAKPWKKLKVVPVTDVAKEMVSLGTA